MNYGPTGNKFFGITMETHHPLIWNPSPEQKQQVAYAENMTIQLLKETLAELNNGIPVNEAFPTSRLGKIRPADSSES